MILITACNKGGGLFSLDEESHKVSKINDIESRGITKDEIGNIYISSHGDLCIYKYNSKLELILVSEKVNHDVHGCFYYKGKIYLVDTYDDKIHIFDSVTMEKISIINFTEDKKLLEAQVPDKINNFFHINDVYIEDDKMYFTSFRNKSTLYKKNKHRVVRHNGFLSYRSLNDSDNIFGKTIIKNLTQPHSPYIHNDEIICCNSRIMSVVIKNLKNYKYRTIKTNGFTRGICVSNDKLYVGISNSVSRKTKKLFDTKVLKSNIEIYDFNTLEKLKNIKINSNEIYGLLNI